MNKEEYYRRLSRVEDRVEKCVVNPQFAHFCTAHRQPTCANTKPRHCAGKGKLEVFPETTTIEDNGKRYTLQYGRRYCEECVGQSIRALAAFQTMGHHSTGPLHMHKMTPAEIQALRDKDASNTE